MYDFFLRITLHGGGGHWVIQQGCRFKMLFVGFPLFESSSLQVDGTVEIA